MDILEKLDMMLGEKHTRAKRRKKERERREKEKKKQLGVTSAPSKEKQKSYVGMGSIKDLLKK